MRPTVRGPILRPNGCCLFVSFLRQGWYFGLATSHSQHPATATDPQSPGGHTRLKARSTSSDSERPWRLLYSTHSNVAGQELLHLDGKCASILLVPTTTIDVGRWTRRRLSLPASATLWTLYGRPSGNRRDEARRDETRQGRAGQGSCGGNDVETGGSRHFFEHARHGRAVIFFYRVAEAHDHTRAQIFQARADPRRPLRHFAALAPQPHPNQCGPPTVGSELGFAVPEQQASENCQRRPSTRCTHPEQMARSRRVKRAHAAGYRSVVMAALL